MPTLEELEKNAWPEPEQPTSRLVETCHRLRKKDIEAFDVEDFRILLGQNIGLPHLMPVALALLENEPLAEGDFYPGDLLAAILRPANWPELESWSARLEYICRAARAALPADPEPTEHNGETYASADMQLTDAIAAFLNRRSHTH